MATEMQHPKQGIRRRTSSYLFRHPKTRRGLTLSGPLLWMFVIYGVSLALLLANAFWRVDSLTSSVVHTWGWQNFDTVFSGNWRTAFLEKTYFSMTVRTVTLALLVTLADLVFAFPVAYFAARMASPRTRSALLIAFVIPLWANYIIRVSAVKALIEGGGLLQDALGAVGIRSVSLTGTPVAMWLTFCYLWLPYAILPIYASLERVPDSLIEASGDLGGRTGMTFRKVVLPLAVPGIVAGSIFTFSLTLGDYFVALLVGKGLFLGNAIFQLHQINPPLAATIALLPLIIIFIYLALARRTGAFEAL
jgi:putative spermidine/putrescine transport system permease protein